MIQTHCPDGWTISAEAVAEGRRRRRNLIAQMRRKHGAIHVQDSYHGAGRYSVQIFAPPDTHQCVADQDLK